jgi:peroxiredoxin Q/BCP
MAKKKPAAKKSAKPAAKKAAKPAAKKVAKPARKVAKKAAPKSATAKASSKAVAAKGPEWAKEGSPAPDFTAIAHDGSQVKLSALKGSPVILYFYPKDDTPGCTKEACSFRDTSDDFGKANAVVLGISPDGEEEHQAFTEKYGLPFSLLSDPDKTVMTAYGAWGEKVLYGKKSIGVIRSTVLIGPDGKVLKHWKKVADAEAHPAQVLKVLAGE